MRESSFVTDAEEKEGAPIGEAVLRFLEGENEGVEIRVNPPRELTMGRSEECDIFLSEKKISRKHCKLSVRSDGITFTDLQSTNGIHLNHKKVTEADVRNGDKLQVGTTVIQVTIHHGNTASMATHVDQPPAAPEPRSPLDQIPDLSPPPPEPALDLEEEASFEIDMLKDEEAPVLEEASSAMERKPKPLSGNLSAMGLADLLQNLAQNQKSGVLHLSSAREGKITVEAGKVLAAETGTAHGVKALYRMLGWHEGEFELLPLPDGFDAAKLEHPMNEPMEALLMEGFRQFDELEKLRKGLPGPDEVLKLKPRLEAPLSKLHPRVLDVLQVILNEEKMEAVLDASPLSDLETAKIVLYLLKKEYIYSSSS